MTGKDCLSDLYELIRERKNNAAENSYTCYLFKEGLDKILKKVGEESAELIIAAKNGAKENIIEEASDLIYHLLVLLVQSDVPYAEVSDELEKRAGKAGNLKAMRETDKNT